TSQCESEEILPAQTFTNGLAIANMFEARSRNRQIFQVARFVSAKPVDHARWLLKRQAPQEQIVDQTKDCCVRADGERKRKHGDDGESRRFSQRPKRVF